MPDWFDERNIYYYNIIYPGNKYENKITTLYITFYKMKAIFKIPLLAFDLLFFCFTCFSENKNLNKMKAPVILGSYDIKILLPFVLAAFLILSGYLGGFVPKADKSNIVFSPLMSNINIIRRTNVNLCNNL